MHGETIKSSAVTSSQYILLLCQPLQVDLEIIP